ncbi:HYR domain-containing protein [Gracilibacillus sp. YIM 98692]|uniref:HYR domain-containing protein n=1 Tax=Gracilibacillus sp. YIM 98692 TaxID=2663532 RepID=UPI00196A08CF|nr:HYR domain-containing protein [Gracilibacillus sp. YIM 98692]
MSQSSICSEEVQNREALIFENNCTKVENVLTVPKIICPGETFTLDIFIKIQVCCSPGSFGLITVDDLTGEVNGPARITGFEATGTPDCQTGCPSGSVNGAISPDGKLIFLSFSDFFVECFGSGDEDLVESKCCLVQVQLVADESTGNGIEPINFDVRAHGFADLSPGAGGPFSNEYNLTSTIETSLVPSNHPCCRENPNPSITCPDNITVRNDPRKNGAIVHYPDPIVSDDFPGVTFSCEPASGSFFPIGETTVTCTATNVGGFTAECTFIVRVVADPCRLLS